ncbi:MAG: hypothetical protein ACTSU5_02095 [Promethearchaeota archaeon]
MVLEVDARSLTGAGDELGVLVEEVKVLEEELAQKIRVEDGLTEDEGFLVPVNNFWIVDKLRVDLKRAREEKERALEEKERALEEKEREVAKLRAELEKLKKA